MDITSRKMFNPIIKVIKSTHTNQGFVSLEGETRVLEGEKYMKKWRNFSLILKEYFLDNE